MDINHVVIAGLVLLSLTLAVLLAYKPARETVEVVAETSEECGIDASELEGFDRVYGFTLCTGTSESGFGVVCGVEPWDVQTDLGYGRMDVIR